MTRPLLLLVLLKEWCDLKSCRWSIETRKVVLGEDCSFLQCAVCNLTWCECEKNKHTKKPQCVSNAVLMLNVICIIDLLNSDK